MGMVDAAILIAMYAVYLWILFQAPPHAVEELSEAPKVSQWAYNLGPKFRWAGITGLFQALGVHVAATFATAHAAKASIAAAKTVTEIEAALATLN